MGVSTDAILCYGVPFPEGYEFPWQTIDNYDFEDWWLLKVCGLEPQKDDESFDDYYTRYRAFREANPCPVTLVYHCSDSYTMYIIAAKGLYKKAYRGEPKVIEPSFVNATDEQRQSVIDFCNTHCQPTNSYDELPEIDPKWYLCSWWG